jgi:hypothetical protein
MLLNAALEMGFEVESIIMIARDDPRRGDNVSVEYR